MKAPLRVLLVEDSATDAELILLTLAAEDIVCAALRVETRADFVHALEQNPVDLILSDHNLPSFDGLSALEIAREKCPDTPFIFVSGTIGEDLAIETLKSGATDYVLKQRLSRLGPSVRRAVTEFDERNARQRAEQALREADALFRSVFQATAVGIAVLNMEQRVIKTNRALQEMLGYGEEELSALRLTELSHREDAALDENLFGELAAGVRGSYQVEKRYRQKSGAIIWGLLTQSLIPRAGNKAEFVVALVEDVSERKRLQQQLVASQKMEAVGRLAAGIAHDFNNVLTVISGYAGLLLARVPAHDRLHREISEISAASQRATALTKRLLSFSRQQVHQPAVLELNTLITSLDHMLRHVSGREIQLVCRLAPDLGDIFADQVQVEQILMNLVINARDATAPGGQVTIRTENSPAAARRDEMFEDSVMLAVTDTGHGMDEATKARIFEPFFTTKEVGKGTGLGLWTVREIVAQNGATILVESEVGHGSEFKIFFPHTRTQRQEIPQVPVQALMKAVRETILVVEDDDALRELLHEVLEAAGYRTVLAVNGSRALEIAESQEHEIQLLVTGLSLPGRPGTSLADQIAALRPGIRVLYVSDCSDWSVLRDDASMLGRAYLQKPFTGDALLRSLRELLDAPNKASIVVADDDPAIRKLLAGVLRTSGYQVFEASGGKQAADFICREHVDLLLADVLLADEAGIEMIQTLRKRFPELRVMAMSGGFGEQLLRITQAVGADHIIRKPFETSVIREDIRRLLAQSRQALPAGERR